MSEEHKFRVNLRGMIDILSNHMYSSPNVFVRELLQNGTDAISARSGAEGFDGGRIDIEVEKGHRIVFCDNGTGLTEDEVHRFLAVIGQSSKYDLENSRAGGDFIGRFGIGLLSCFMVTDEIEVKTRSYKEGSPALIWKGKADGTYTLSELDEDMPAGTRITLLNNKQGEDRDEGIDDYYDTDTIANLVYYYGLFLKYPVYVKNGEECTRLNLKFDFDAEKDKPLCLSIGKTFLGEEFLDCFRLRSESGLFSGIAYVLPYPVSASAHNMHRIYLKNMLLTESGEKLLPEWAFFIRCIINTDRLTPTSSREDFYEDDLLEKAKQELSDCIEDYFTRLDIENENMLYKIVRIHDLAVRSVLASSDGLDDVLLPYILFETSMGEMSGRTIMHFGTIAFYTTDVDRFRQLAPLYAQRGTLLINAGYVYESAILLKLAGKSRKTDIERLTGNDIDLMLDEPSCADTEGAQQLIDIADEVLKSYNCRASLKEFMPEDIPALYDLSEAAYNARQIKRSKENANPVFSSVLSSLEKGMKDTSTTLYLNASNKIIQGLIEQDNYEKISCYTEIIYVQSLLSGHFPLLHNEMKALSENLYRLMEF